MNRGIKTETLYEVDMIIDRTLQRAEDGLRLIEEMDRLGFLNMAKPRNRNTSTENESDGNSCCEASFESNSSGIGESISSTNFTIPVLDSPIPPARNRRSHSSFIRRTKSSSSF